MPPLNILYLHSHDTGRYIQPYGFALETPRLQELAQQGVLFRKNFCAGPTCSPSRAALLSGQSPHSCGMYGLAHRGFRMADYNRHLARFLQSHGYETVLAGFEHEGVRKHDPQAYIVDPGCKGDRDIPGAVRDFLKQRDESRPFFLSAGFEHTHRLGESFHGAPDDIHSGPTTSDERYLQPPAVLPDTPETRRDFALYADSVRGLDRLMGEVLDAIDDAGLAEATLVICTTDHGIAFPRMKCNLTDHGIGVMLLMRGPGGFDGGKVIDAMTSHIDLFPTLCDLAGLDRPDWLEGESLLPLVSGQADAIHDEVFSEVSFHAAYEPKRCVRTDRYKYIRRWDRRSKPVMPNIDDSITKSYLAARAGWETVAPPQEQLYDLLLDPQETCNLAARPDCQHALDDMRSRLKGWMERTADPLLEGTVQPPPEAVVNDPDGASPAEKPKPAR